MRERSRRLFILLAGAATALLSPRPSPAQVELHAFVSTGYSYNFNQPPSRTNQLRVFDVDDNSFRLDVAEIVAQKVAARSGEAGFRVDVVAGSSIPRVSAAAGLFRDPATGEAEDIDLQQAFVTYVARVGRGLRVDAGKFVTHMGYEVIEGYDAYDDNASRSFLFGYAIPFTHTGVRVSYAPSGAVTAQLHVVNGWDDARDNNTAKSVGAQLALTPSSRTSLVLNAMTGAERADDNDDLRSVVDAVATWKALDALSVGVNLDYGREENLPAAGTTATWKGAAVYARVGVSSRVALCGRGEVFDDVDGVRTGVLQRLGEVTLTPEVRVTPQVILRGDVRFDWSTEDVFDSDDGPKAQQPTASVNVLFAF